MDRTHGARELHDVESSAVNEQPVKILIAILADAQQLRFAACRALLRNESQPSSELPSTGERRAVANRGDDRCSDQHSDAGHCDQSLTGQILSRDRLDFEIQMLDLLFHRAPFLRQPGIATDRCAGSDAAPRRPEEPVPFGAGVDGQSAA